MSNICLSGSVTNRTTHINGANVSRLGSSIIADTTNETAERLNANVSMLNDKITAVVSSLHSNMVVSVVNKSSRMHATISPVCTIGTTTNGLIFRVIEGNLILSDSRILTVKKDGVLR